MSFAEDMRHHNNPPPDLLTGDALRQSLLDRFSDLLKRRDDLLAAASRVPEIADEDVARRVSDFIKQVTAASKAADTARIGAKEPYLEGGRGIDGFFKAISDPLANVKKSVEANLTAYLREKEAEERRKRMEAERLAREAAETAIREAEEAEKALRDQQSLDAAVQAGKAADAARADAVKAMQAAAAKPAELSRVRGDFGAVSSLRTEWTFDHLNRADLDLETLRQHLPTDALEKAVRAFIRSGGRHLRGVEIFETTTAVVR